MSGRRGLFELIECQELIILCQTVVRSSLRISGKGLCKDTPRLTEIRHFIYEAVKADLVSCKEHEHVKYPFKYSAFS